MLIATDAPSAVPAEAEEEPTEAEPEEESKKSRIEKDFQSRESCRFFQKKRRKRRITIEKATRNTVCLVGLTFIA